MNAAETIAAAVEKLIELRAAGSAGEDEWKVWRAPSGIRSAADYEWIVFDDGGETYRIAEKQNWGTSADMQMIVTLHRTIDAQLAILRGFHDHLTNPAWDHEADEETAPVVVDVTALARAILGEAS